MDLTTDTKKRRRSARGRKTSKLDESKPPPSSAIFDALEAGGSIGPASPGAPIARAPRFDKTAGPIDLGNGAQNWTADTSGRFEEHRRFDDLPEGEPGGRRSRAFGVSLVDQVADEAPDRPLKVVAGGGSYDIDDEPEVVSHSLSPSNATALGDFAAAMAGPLAGAIYLRSVAVFIAAALLVLLVRSQARRSALSEGEVSAISPLFAAIGVFALSLAVDWQAGFEQAAVGAGAALLAGSFAALILKLVTDRFVHVRVAVIGEAGAAHDLAWQLAREGVRRYSVLGYVTRTTERDNLRDLSHVSFKVRRLGLLSDLSHIVARNDIDLLVMASDDDRLKVFERATVCAERYRTRLISSTAFEEAVFRRVPLEQLNVAWFQHIMHPRFRPAPRSVTRAIDIGVAVLVGLITAPVWLATAGFIKVAFGAPVLVRRRRVGERGRSYSIVRFRVAPNEENGDAPAEDEPAAGFGRFLRRTHIEALPQLLNVLRGDMSLVGPEPAAPKLVSQVEGELPFYGRRHLVRPGLTGWAQLHRLPEEADDPAATLSHDLFYLKHQSLFLYVYVLLAATWNGLTGSRRATAASPDSPAA